MALSGKQKHYLRGLAHQQKSVVTIGNNGVSDALIGEVKEALNRHELIKIKLPALTGVDRTKLLSNICSQTGAETVQTIGRVGVIYRPSASPRIQFPE